ncbi:MAG: hypothetical protein AAGA68_14185 [Pseudomonadota bacterium]
MPRGETAGEAPRARQLPVLIAEVALIVLGILLGLWLDERREDHELAEFVARSQQVMRAELRENFSRIEQSRAYHIELLPTIVAARDAARDAAAQDGPSDVPSSLPKYRGFGTPPVTRAAYETALSAALFARVDPEESAAIAYAYEQVAAVLSTIDRYKVGLAVGGRDFYGLTSAAFADTLYAEDAALAAIAPLIDASAPPSWYTLIDVQPY